MYELAIIGAGWAGFNAAIRARQLGLKTVLIEKGQIGGTCLNRGCIPTKTLIQSAKIYHLTKKAKTFGVEIPQANLNFSQIQSRKDSVVAKLRQGMDYMLKGIDILSGTAEIIDPNTIKAVDKEVKAKNILLACGAKPIELNNIKFDHRKIVSSDDILDLKELPGSLLIIGGGVIGCEFASLFSTFGVKVSVVEKMPQLLPGEDKEAAKKLENIFKKKGISVSTDTDATGLGLDKYDLVLLCIGRVPDLEGLGLDKLGIKMERNRIVTDEYLRTCIPNLYAAGDCTGKIMLAHFAAYQGRIASENIAHPDSLKKADNAVVPNCIFTDPEIASVGLNEEQARAKGYAAGVNKFDFLGSGMAHILDETEGFLKVIFDKNSQDILGGVIIGPRATELIAILTLAVSSRLKVSQIRDTIFAHPSISESIAEVFKP